MPLGEIGMTQAGYTTSPAPQIAGWLWLSLLIAIAIEFLGGLGALPILAGDLNEVPGPGLGGAIIIATIILHPLAALAALVFLIRGNLNAALVALAVVVLVSWVAYLPSVRLHGLEVAPDAPSILVAFIIMILPPIVTVAVSALALANTRLTLATLLAILPTLIGVLSVLAFGIGVAIYGF